MILSYTSDQLRRVGQAYRAPVLPDVFKQLRLHNILKADQRRRRGGRNKSVKIPSNGISTSELPLVCSKSKGQLTTVKGHDQLFTMNMTVVNCRSVRKNHLFFWTILMTIRTFAH